MADNAAPKQNGTIDLMRQLKTQLDSGEKIPDHVVQALILTGLISIKEDQCKMMKVTEWPSVMYYLRYYPLPTLAVLLVVGFVMDWLFAQKDILVAVLKAIGVGV